MGVNSWKLTQLLMALNHIRVMNCEGIVFNRGDRFRKVILKTINFNWAITENMHSLLL